MTGDLDLSARLITMFFLASYGFFRLASGIQSWSGITSFRPDFKTPAWISFTGAFTCVAVMFKLDMAAMAGATVVMVLLFYALKWKEFLASTQFDGAAMLFDQEQRPVAVYSISEVKTLRGLFFRKQARIEQSFEAFLGCIQRSVELFCTGLLSYLESGPGESFERSAKLVSRAESEADTLRREIERVLYENELMPDSRGDLLNLLESCDKVANRLESVVRSFCLRRTVIPHELEGSIKEILVPVQTCVETLLTAVRLLFSEPRKAKPAIDDVTRLESECDRIQQDTIRTIYRMDLELARQMQLEQTINDIGSIADRAEEAAGVLEIIAIKRSL